MKCTERNGKKSNAPVADILHKQSESTIKNLIIVLKYAMYAFGNMMRWRMINQIYQQEQIIFL